MKQDIVDDETLKSLFTKLKERGKERAKKHHDRLKKAKAHISLLQMQRRVFELFNIHAEYTDVKNRPKAKDKTPTEKE